MATKNTPMIFTADYHAEGICEENFESLAKTIEDYLNNKKYVEAVEQLELCITRRDYRRFMIKLDDVHLRAIEITKTFLRNVKIFISQQVVGFTNKVTIKPPVKIEGVYTDFIIEISKISKKRNSSDSNDSKSKTKSIKRRRVEAQRVEAQRVDAERWEAAGVKAAKDTIPIPLTGAPFTYALKPISKLKPISISPFSINNKSANSVAFNFNSKVKKGTLGGKSRRNVTKKKIKKTLMRKRKSIKDKLLSFFRII